MTVGRPVPCPEHGSPPVTWGCPWGRPRREPDEHPGGSGRVCTAAAWRASSPRAFRSPGPPRHPGRVSQHLPAGPCPAPARHADRRVGGCHPSPALPAPARRNSWGYLFWPISLIYWHIFGRRTTLSSNHFAAASSSRHDRSGLCRSARCARPASPAAHPPLCFKQQLDLNPFSLKEKN